MIFNICVLDDSIMMRKFLGNLCNKYGNVELFEQPFELLAKIEAGYAPDIILLDLNMPQMHGTEFLEKLKPLNKDQNIKVIVVSSSDSSNERINSLRLGAWDYILKPFHPDELEIRLKRELSRSSALNLI